MTFTQREREYLADQTLGRLATRRPDGSLQNNPVGFSLDEANGTLDITGRALGATRKFSNVADNGQVALVVDDLASRDPWTVRGLEIRGIAVALTIQQTQPVYSSHEVIRITPYRVISWGLDGGEMRARDVGATRDGTGVVR